MTTTTRSDSPRRKTSRAEGGSAAPPPSGVAEHLAPVALPSPEPVRPLRIADIVPDPNNPRSFAEDAAFEELVTDIRKRGVIHNIVVRPYPAGNGAPPAPYLLVAGERRWRAAQRVGFEIINAMIKQLSEEDAYEWALVENITREGLAPIDEAKGFKRLIDVYRFTHEDIAAKITKSVRYVLRRLLLLNLPEGAFELHKKDLLTFGALEELARAPAPIQKDFVESMLKQLAQGGARFGWTRTYNAQEMRDHVRQEAKVLPLAKAPFDTTDETLQPGACTRCPKNTASQRVMFDDEKGPGECLDRDCYNSKLTQGWDKMKAQAQAAGTRVLEGDETKEFRASFGTQLAYGGGMVDLDTPCEDDPAHQAAMDKWEAEEQRLADEDPDGKMPDEPEPKTYKELLGPYLKEHPEELVLMRLPAGQGFGQINIVQGVPRERLPDLLHNAGHPEIAQVLRAEAQQEGRSSSAGTSRADHERETALRNLEIRVATRVQTLAIERVGEFIAKSFAVACHEDEEDQLKALLREMICATWTKKNSPAAKRRGLGAEPAAQGWDEKKITDEPRLAEMETVDLLAFYFELELERENYHNATLRGKRAFRAVKTTQYDEELKQQLKDEKAKARKKEKSKDKGAEKKAPSA